MAKPKNIQVHVHQDEIAQLAHMNWLADGCPDGCDLNYWLEAESQLKATKHLLLVETQKTQSGANGNPKLPGVKLIQKYATKPELSRK